MKMSFRDDERGLRLLGEGRLNRINSRAIPLGRSRVETKVFWFCTRATRRTRGFSMFSTLALVLCLVLLGFAFFATRGPMDSMGATGGAPLSEVSGADRPDLKPEMPEPALDELRDSLETVAEAGEDRSSPEPLLDQSRVSKRPVVEAALPNQSGGLGEGVKKSPEQRRADREARRALAMGPPTAAEAIARVISPQDEDALWLDGGWTPPDESVLRDLSPELRERLGLGSPEDGPRPEPNFESGVRLVVVDYTYGSPGKRAGLEVGDEIIRYFGEPVESLRQLTALMALAESFGPKRVDIQVQGSDGIHDLEIRPGRLGVILNGE